MGRWPPLPPAAAPPRPCIVIVAVLAIAALVGGAPAVARPPATAAGAASSSPRTLAEGRGRPPSTSVLGPLHEAGATRRSGRRCRQAEDGTRTATLAWTWTLPDDAGTWEYTTEAT